MDKLRKSSSEETRPAEETRNLLPQQQDRRAVVLDIQDSPGREIELSSRRSEIVASPSRESTAAVQRYVVDGECSSNSSFRRKSSLLSRTKTKSRLTDPPEQDRIAAEYDPFLDADIPEDYKKMNLSALSVIQLVSLFLIVAALSSTLAIKKLREMTLFELHIWKWELTFLVLICGRLVSGWLIRLIVFFIEGNFLFRKRVLYFVYGVKNAVQNCLWLVVVLNAWLVIFDERVERLAKGKVLTYITRILVCLLAATVIWLFKTLVVKCLASSFHVSTFFDRIQDSLFNQYVIETLSGPPLIEVQHGQEAVTAEGQEPQNAGAKVIGSGKPDATNKLNDGISINHLHRLNQKNVSAWNMKKLINIVRKGSFSTLDEKIYGSGNEDGTAVQITTEKQAKAASKKIFHNVARPGSEFIYLEDLMRFLKEDEAAKAMLLFEGASESKGISKLSLKNWVVTTFRERRALALSLNDTKTAVNKLHQMMNVAAGFIILVICLLILQIATTGFFVFLGSQLLVAVFMFGDTCKKTFEAIIFLFVMHPFDVGDRCEIDGVQMIVEEMNILTTVFLRFDNEDDKIFYPNSVLATKPIHNYYRSPVTGDARVVKTSPAHLLARSRSI